MLGPCDFQPGQSKVAVTFKYVKEGGKFYAVMSFGGNKDNWQRVEINHAQVAHFVADSFLDVVKR
jgi:hypothetical protein